MSIEDSILSAAALWGLLVLIAASAACHEPTANGSESSRAQAAHESMKPSLRWEEAAAPDRATVARLPAEVVTPEHRTVRQGPPVDAIIQSWRISPGQTVEVGQPLAEVTAPELTDLEADIQRMQRVVQKRQSAVEQRRENVEGGFQTATELMDAEVQLEEAVSTLRSLRRQASARRGQALRRSDSGHLWMATASGVVSELSCTTGQLRRAGEACVTITPKEGAVVRVDIPQQLSARLSEDVRAEWRSLGASRQAPGLQMVMTRRGGAVQPANHTRRYSFRPAPEADLAGDLLVGEAGWVTLEVPAPEDSVLVPRLAVTRMENTPTIFVKRDGEAVQVNVDVLGEYETDYLVRGEGLKPGVPVVADGAFNLKSQRVLQ